jgi:hypothetical protein
MKVLSLLGVASVVACGLPASDRGETAGAQFQELAGGGITATLGNVSASGGNYSAKITMTNNSSDPMTNWNASVKMGTVTLLTGNTSGAEVEMIAGYAVFNPGPYGTTLAANGGSTSFTFYGQYAGSSYTAPTINLVDGHGNGNAGGEWPNDGVDHMARAAATAAFNLAIAYENNKLPDNGDPDYGLYDSLIWSAHMFVINSAGTGIEFDTNAPGYAFVPTEALNALDLAQDSKEVGSYLASGLASCFAKTNGSFFYQFKANALKGFTQHEITSGTVPGWTPPGNNGPANPIDQFTVSNANLPNGASSITMTLTSSLDYWFSTLAYNNINIFPNTSKVASKFSGGSTAGCSPFNGPGGTNNPHLVLSLNGQPLPARVVNPAEQCQNPGCTSKLVIDPDAYAVAGPYFNTIGAVGPQTNPFQFDTSTLEATPDHYGQWACYVNQSSSNVCGIFSSPISKRGMIAGYLWVQCGTAGAGC